ncbi:MAG: hypothetical protein KF687_12040 [Cyclobacteriaceae bacterium]|nr:hypothetical protein [Cyclobacteriaceae bacterium]
MENKWLTIQSFEKNQNLLELINKLLIHFKLNEKGIDAQMSDDEIDESKRALTNFLKKLNFQIHGIESGSDTLTGIDSRSRKLIRNFMEARNRGTKFKSILFKSSPSKVLEILNSNDKEEKAQLINSLTELRGLLEDHVAFDAQDLIGEI